MTPLHLIKPLSFACCLLLAGACASSPAAPQVERALSAPGEATQQVLAYHQRLQAMSAADLARERGILQASAPGPWTQFRLALVLAQIHAAGDLVRAQALLENLVRATTGAAQPWHAAARFFLTQFQERIRLEANNERLAQQLKDRERQAEALQEKLDAMADIERTLPPRSGAAPAAAAAVPGSAPR